MVAFNLFHLQLKNENFVPKLCTKKKNKTKQNKKKNGILAAKVCLNSAEIQETAF